MALVLRTPNAEGTLNWRAYDRLHELADCWEDEGYELSANGNMRRGEYIDNWVKLIRDNDHAIVQDHAQRSAAALAERRKARVR